MATTLNSAFWTKFAAQTWEHEPLVVKDFKSPLRALDAAEVFSLLVRYSDQCRKKKTSEGFKFYIDGQRLNADDVLQVLPIKADKNLSGYHKRMSKSFADYCLVCDELLNVNQKKQAILANFTADLYAHVGFPNRFSEMGLYLGNYRKTPFGVHVDGCGVFSFPVAGQKRFRTWPAAFVKKNPALARAFKYEKYKKGSRLLTAGPGDMTYWPSSEWHIAESDGSFSATWSLGVWVDKPLLDVATETLASLLASKLGDDGALTVMPLQKTSATDGEIAKLPAPYAKLISALQNFSGDEIQEALEKSWMQHLSKQGFKTLPKEKAKLGATLRLRNKNSPIFWHRSKDGQRLSLSFAGKFIETQNSSELIEFIKALNSGKTCAAKQFLKGSSKTKNMKCLRELAVAGAFA